MKKFSRSYHIRACAYRPDGSFDCSCECNRWFAHNHREAVETFKQQFRGCPLPDSRVTFAILGRGF